MNYLIIGAGPSGLAMANSLRRAGISYDHIEADDNLGGNWYHGVYENVYTDACKEVMAFPDLPMPDSFRDFLTQEEMLAYLNHYAEENGLRSRIRFRIKAIRVFPVEDNHWEVHFADLSQRRYAGVIVCTGHHWDFNEVEIPGNFSGEIIHAKAYKTPDQLRNKKVLVLGSGNSAADIACEAARVGASATISMKDSPWIFPKSFAGVPLGRVKLRGAPAFLQPFLTRLLIRLTFGKHESYGLEPPKHKPFEKHPTVSEELPYYLRHRRIDVKPVIRNARGSTVFFDDGSSIEADLIVGATGYKLSFPFLPPELSRVEDKHLLCIGHCAFEDYKGLYFLGWQQVRGGIGSLVLPFSKVIAELIRIEQEYEVPAGQVLRVLGNNVSTTHLYGAREIIRWIDKHLDEGKLKRAARRVRRRNHHLNRPVATAVEPYRHIKVF